MSACNCREEVEGRLLERFQEQETEATGHSASLQGYSFILKEGQITKRPVMTAELTATYQTRRGPRERTRKLSVAASYCPFCGQEIGE